MHAHERKTQYKAIFIGLLLLGQHTIEALEAEKPSLRGRSPNGASNHSNGTTIADGVVTVSDKSLFAQPDETVKRLVDNSPTVDSRRLAVITTVLPTQVSINLIIVGSSPVRSLGNPSVTGIWAGNKINTVEIELGNNNDQWSAPSATLRIVTANTTSTMAQAGYCLNDHPHTYGSELTNGTWATNTGGQLQQTSSTLLTATELDFKMGGEFRFCYSHDGTFQTLKADIVPVTINVYGVYDGCYAPDCLQKRPYHCYLMKQRHNTRLGSYSTTTSCMIDYSRPGAGVKLPVNALGKGSWSESFTMLGAGTGYDSTGLASPVQEKLCTTAPADFICKDGGSCDAGDYFLVPASNRISIPVTRDDLMGDTLKAHTVAACFCPSFGSCDADANFMQRIGLLHFYVAKVCPHFDPFCQQDFTGTTPRHRFTIRVECPTNACKFGDTNRLKIVYQTAANDIPSWDQTSGCRTAKHGESALTGGVQLLPQTLYSITNSSTIEGNPDHTKLNGGNRQDYKNFAAKWDTNTLSGGGFVFQAGTTHYENYNFHNTKVFDICYCDDDCDNPLAERWFKVGAMRFNSYRLTAGFAANATQTHEWTVKYVNLPGTLGIARPALEYGTMGMQEDGIIKFVSDDSMTQTEMGCAKAPFDPGLTSGMTPNNVGTDFKAMSQYGNSEVTGDTDRLVFNSGDSDNHVSIKKAGVFAVCYCAFTYAGKCTFDVNWRLATHITIAGPVPDHKYEFSTHVVFRLEYNGWALSNKDRIRIISRESECTDNNLNPQTGSFQYTHLKMMCPHPCTAIGETEDTVNGDLSTSVLADDAFECNNQNAECKQNDVRAIRVIDATKTEIEFDAPPGLVEGDIISLGANVMCDTSDPADAFCTDEHVAAVKGRYDFADKLAVEEFFQPGEMAAPGEYIVGHRVSTTEDNKKFTVPVGWATRVPKFKVQYMANKRGRWMRHNKAITKEEIYGGKERLGLKVCWKTPDYGTDKMGHPLGYTVAQVGTLDIKDSNQMEDCSINLTTIMMDQKAPFIISFTTASAQTGKRYTTVQGMTQLKIVFVRTFAFDAHYADLAASNIDDNQSEDEFHEAQQYICGKLFKELWSNDGENGFPLPKGCYYRSYGFKREFYLLFETKNGLRAGGSYQIVMNGSAKKEAIMGGEYIEVYTMDDVEKSPYLSIERGIARLNKNTKEKSYGSDGGKFMEPGGFKIVGGSGELHQLSGTNPIHVEMLGDPTNTAPIMKSSVLRVFLWPLTQWDTYTDCVADCLPLIEGTTCGRITSCKGEATVANFQNNVLKLVLPDTMTPLGGATKHLLILSGFKLPETGFFPDRISAQVTNPDESKPNFIVSTGDYVYKEPEDGMTVAKLVSFLNDGNQSPYKGDESNVVYAKIVFAATLFSKSLDGNAWFTVTMPEGYECVQPQDINGKSAWETPHTLGVFGAQNPQGRGKPDDGKALHGWTANGNQCRFTLRENGVIYSGSSMFVRFTINNPPEALARTDTANRWKVEATSKGQYIVALTYPPAIFKASEEHGYFGTYTENLAVLGKIANATCQPTNFAMSGGPNKREENDVQVFFTTEQNAGAGGFINVIAPEGYQFDPCVAGEIKSHQYGRGYGETTYPIPGVSSCVYHSSPWNRAEIGVVGILEAKRTYGFTIRVRNPDAGAFSSAFTGSWKILIANKFKHLIDGTKEPIPFFQPKVLGVPAAMAGWSLYQESWAPAFLQINIFNRHPYSMTGATTEITVWPFQVPKTVYASLRLIAPDGYMWDFSISNDGFKYTTDKFPGIDANFPGGFPAMQNDCVLTWDAATYVVGRVYGFSGLVRVPDRSPASSSNAFFVELGYDQINSLFRHVGGVVEAKLVKTLLNAEVDYSSNVEGKQNKLSLSIRLATPVLEGGGLKVKSPPGFQIVEPCVIGTVEGQEALGLPMDVTCSSVTDDETKETTLIIRAGYEGIPAPQLYYFSVLAQNPPDAVNMRVADTSCGVQHCWHFESIGDLMTDGPKLDAPLAAPSFQINRKMVEASLVPISDEQRILTNRIDRPLAENHLIFAFKTNSDAIDGGVVTLRGPEGFKFYEECLSGLETRGEKVFGEGQSFPPGYDPFEPGVLLTECKGQGPMAVFKIQAGLLGLKAEIMYAFRIKVQHNPFATPDPNLWTLDFNGESSAPFPGFTLWSFTNTTVVAVSTAQGPGSLEEERVQNPVTISMRPHKTIDRDLPIKDSGGMLRVTAPAGFEFVQLNLDGLCFWAMYEVQANEYWEPADFKCLVDTSNPRRVWLTLASNKRIFEGKDYHLTLKVYNPNLWDDKKVHYWKVESFASDDRDSPRFALDETDIPSFNINKALDYWFYRNEDPQTGVSSRNGKDEVKDLYFAMRFAGRLEYDNLIEIQAPAGFDTRNPFNPRSGLCNGFAWEPAGVKPYLPKSAPRCKDNIIQFIIKEDEPWPKGRDLTFIIDTRNPASTPVITENFWTVTHYSTPGPDGTRTILSSKAKESWEVVPQLESLVVSLVGEQRAAESISGIGIEFIPVSDADELWIDALAPEEFDFTGAKVTSSGHEVLDASGNKIRLKVPIFAGRKTYVQVEKFRLGKVGGATSFDLRTRFEKEKRDEKLQFKQGFRLPGRLKVHNKMLFNEYHLDKARYPLKSILDVQRGKPAFASFVFTLTKEAFRDTEFMMNVEPEPGAGAPYMLNSTSFMLLKGDLNEGETTWVNATVYDPEKNRGGYLKAKLNSMLLANTKYTVVVGCTPPQNLDPKAMHWRFETHDGGALPVNTNDARTEGFVLMADLLFSVRALRSPPMAQVEVELMVDPSETRPTALLVIAPEDFIFADDCLVTKSIDVKSCEPYGYVAGRHTALLTCREDGLQESPPNLKVLVKLPPVTPKMRSWFIQSWGSYDGVDKPTGWGEDVGRGFPVVQMRDSGIIYPGIPEKRGVMAVSFKTQEKMDVAAYVRVMLPPTFGANCNEDEWNPVSLPHETSSCMAHSKENYLEITINQTLVPGLYSFTVLSIPPAAMPEHNIFSLLVLNKNKEVADAAMNIPGYEIRHGIKMVGTELIWSNSEMGKLTVISLGFSLTEALPEKDPPEIAEILIMMPDDFEHTVKTNRDLAGIESLPIESGNDWLDFENVKYLRIKLDKEKTKTLAVGTYNFVFPALIPQPLMPPRNFWTISICSSSEDGCRSRDDPSVIATFPFPGFQYGDVNPASLRKAAGAPRGADFCRLLLSALVAISLAGALW
eukprot:gnl/MRDRNA2_/MRDRNA2_93924_c0_seq1.p1 gnl/MRDRNA2_/MRDRNA2_93924_c0~~gnl/MRDRNA2_/MRDRNA2_93924_c0_seq1.p1  ORF type:complete len:3212 (+),score=535.85 gnl/MRDRNA2_/MRDRNA2_93924_c0_seq1:111-9746(+)